MKSGNAVWSEGVKKIGNSKRGSKMLWMWGSGTQEVGVFKEEGKKEKGGNGTSMRGVGESEGA